MSSDASKEWKTANDSKSGNEMMGNIQNCLKCIMYNQDVYITIMYEQKRQRGIR
jgi:hypothetical protein